MSVTNKVRPAPQQHERPARRKRYVAIDRYELRRQGMFPPRRQERRMANEYRVVKRPLIAAASGRGGNRIPRGNLIMITSALSGEGKTFTCLNLCLSLALEKDWSVVLVDGDVIEQSLSHALGVESEPGLMDVLSRPDLTPESFILPTDLEGLSVLPAGQRSEFAVEMLSSERMETVAEHLSTSRPNRIVVFDSPPLLMTTEAPVLASHMGQVLMVVQAGRTSQQRVEQALSKLDPDKLINLVLNQAELGDEALAYGLYGYGSRYRGHAE